MRNSTKAVAAGIAVAAIAARAWKWRRDYKTALWAKQAAEEIRAEIPYDVVGDFRLRVEELEEFDAIAGYTCMQECCYTPLTTRQVEEYGLFGEDDGGLFLE